MSYIPLFFEAKSIDFSLLENQKDPQNTNFTYFNCKNEYFQLIFSQIRVESESCKITRVNNIFCIESCKITLVIFHTFIDPCKLISV